ncbi:MAG TPA: acetylglutamate kinase [Tepidiformaceae bacterium]|nr:acetylglutamate kinase [Tepidiformaceae bacterium]
MSGPLAIKIGGSTLGNADTTFRDIARLARSGDVPVVIHGGGSEASRWLEAMNIPSRFERGLRVTDEPVLPVVVAVFAGLVNKRIVAAINAEGAAAVGLSGADGRTLRCKLASPDLGFVGEPESVDPRTINALRAAGLIPVISSIGYVPGDGVDQLVNVNADVIAGAVASAVGARQLLFLTDVEGVRDAEGAAIPSMDSARARALISDGTIAGGMIPKVETCLLAVSAGVPVRILDGRQPGAIREHESRGTVITP